MKKLVILLSLLFVIFLAGCTTKPVTTSGSGVVITKFSPDISEVTGGSTASISMLVDNTGGSDAKMVKAELIGLPDSWNISYNDKKVRTTDDIGPLAGVDPEHGFPNGGQAFITWDIKPVPTHEVTQTYSFSGRVYYSYNTISDSVVRIVSTDYFRSLSEEGQNTLKKGVLSSSTSKGPLSVIVRVPEVLVDSGTTGQMPVIFEITNTGGGRVFDKDAAKPGSTSLDKISITGEGVNCTSGNSRLVQGKAARISCSLSIGESIENFKDYSVKLTIFYNYFSEASSSMKVLKSLSGLTTPSASNNNNQQPKNPSAPDNNPPKITEITSVGGNSTSPYETTDSTPDIKFTTDNNAQCRISIYPSVASYDKMTNDKGVADCTGTEKSHTCTVPATDSHPEVGIDHTAYIACRGSNNKDSDTKTVTYKLIAASPDAQSPSTTPCSGVLHISMSETGTCTVTADVSASNCKGKSFAIKDNSGFAKCAGIVSDDYFYYTCPTSPSWTVTSGDKSTIYTFTLSIGEPTISTDSWSVPCFSTSSSKLDDCTKDTTDGTTNGPPNYDTCCTPNPCNTYTNNHYTATDSCKCDNYGAAPYACRGCPSPSS